MAVPLLPGTSPFGAHGYNPEGVRFGQEKNRNFRAVKVWDRRVFMVLDGNVERVIARIQGLVQPLVVVARSKAGIDFDAPDGKPAHLIVLILTEDNQSQNDLLGDAGELFTRKDAIEQTLDANTYVELVAALNAPVR